MSFDQRLFSAAIQARMQQHGLSVREAAKEAGISASTISRLTNGEAPDIESFAVVCRWLEMDANQFLEKPSGGDAAHDLWITLYYNLQWLEVPDDCIEAIVRIVRLIRRSEQS